MDSGMVGSKINKKGQYMKSKPVTKSHPSRLAVLLQTKTWQLSMYDEHCVHHSVHSVFLLFVRVLMYLI